jgi:uncharacterized protein YeaO (DUF488 family)
MASQEWNTPRRHDDRRPQDGPRRPESARRGIPQDRPRGHGGRRRHAPEIRIRRVYEPPGPDDGTRVLVDRLWPRGLAKDGVPLDAWLKEVAPSDGLRKWYHHDPDRYGEFSEHYRAELAEPDCGAALDRLREFAAVGPLTLLTAVKDLSHSHARVLLEALSGGDAESGGARAGG